MEFKTQWNSSGQLEFVTGDAPAPVVITDIITASYVFAPLSSCTIDSIITATGEAFSLAPQANADISCISDIVATCSVYGVSSAGEVTVDINVDRGPKTDIATITHPSSRVPQQISSEFAASPRLACSNTAIITDADRACVTVTAPLGRLPKLSSAIEATLIDAVKAQAEVTHFNHLLDRVNNALSADHADAVSVGSNVASGYKYPPRGDCSVANAWAHAETLQAQINSDFNDGIAVKIAWLARHENAINAIGTRPVTPIEPPVTPPSANPILNFLALWDNSGELDFLRIELDALIIMNEINIYHVASDGARTAVHPINASLDFDIDSFVWSFNGQLLGKENLALLTHRAGFEININGHQLRFTLREFSRAASFANDAYSFTCVTNTQWLGQPYAALYNGTVDNPIGAWQLVAEKFATEAFTLNRSLTPEWTLQPDSFSYLNKSPIELALQVAQASGAILQPDKLENIIHVQPRYKTSPWDWDALTNEECDHVINADYVDTESSNDNTTPQTNSVLVSGETHGVITEVVKAGTAGDVRAKDVLSPLSQDHNANAELARNIMADSGEQEVLGLSVPLLPPDSAFGLLLPGEIIRVVYPDKTITGLCLSNSIPVQSITDISQSVKLELNNGYR